MLLLFYKKNTVILLDFSLTSFCVTKTLHPYIMIISPETLTKELVNPNP